MKTDEQIIAELASILSPKPPRAKPHRCIDCGRVTKHVRCDECRKAAKS